MAIARSVAPHASGPTARLRSLDVVRGAVMVLMAIDHVRVYAGVPAGGPTVGLFFTRWVTHFCAPAFVFFAGTAAFLHGRKLGDRGALARYLFARGLLLVALELTYLHVAWTFTFDFSQLLAGVIWMLGWCMVLMAALVWLPTPAIGALGLFVMATQQLFRVLPQALPGWLRESTAAFWQLWYLGGSITLGPGGSELSILYSIAPWIGVMAAGYWFGTIMLRDTVERRRLCLPIGVSATAMFLVLGGLALALRSPQDDSTPILFRLLDQNKYRDSQLFLLMTLGPTIAVLPAAERARGWLANVLETFGRVPLFYYLLHIPLIHATALLVWLMRDGHLEAGRFASAPYVSVPDDQQWSLPLLYLVFVIVAATLYPLCRWFGRVKSRQRNSWLRYI